MAIHASICRSRKIITVFYNMIRKRINVCFSARRTCSTLFLHVLFRQQNDTSTLDLVIRQDLYWPDGTSQPCKACNNPDKFDIKHPDSSVELAAGHLDPRTQFSGFTREIDFYDSEDEDRYLRDAEAELRRVYKGLDDPRVIERLFTLPPGVTIVQD
ncbi:unnamed protein product [Miscanthus lutarioriparius]|uniref:Uncharacterized protein n=1 Tax=Miscanthus lutarioriparius TaxID=422564 RepID=A0A811MJF3_9POAL|nr:unnamed protein product [Miscanthus lutarioriparius]